MVISRDPRDGRVSVITADFAAIRDSKGVWSHGFFTPVELMEDFVLIRDEKEASELLRQAQETLSSSATRP